MEEALAVLSIVCTGLLPLSSHLKDNEVGIDPHSQFQYIKANAHIVLHLINALLIYIISKTLFKRFRNYDSNDNIKYALIAPILFNLHPIHTAALNGSVSIMPYLSLCLGLSTCLIYFRLSSGLIANLVCLVLGSVFMYISNTFTLPGLLLIITYSQNKTWTFILAMVFISYFYFTQMRDLFSFDYVENMNKIVASTTVKCSISRLSMAIAGSLNEFLAISGTGNGSYAADSLSTVVTTILLIFTVFFGVPKVEVNGSPWQLVSCGLVALFFINYAYIVSQFMGINGSNSVDMTTKRYISLSIACSVLGFLIVDVKRGLGAAASTSESAGSNALVYKASPVIAWAFHLGVECVILAMVVVTVKALLLNVPVYGAYLPQYIVNFVKLIG